MSCKDVKELGQLVQAGLPQELAHAGDVLLRILQHMGRHVSGSVDPHGAELEDVEVGLALAYTLLLE